jgi:PBP1b-binding outer membrane lipoprotein LpoB
MKSNIGILISTLIFSGCASTTMEDEYSDLSVTDNEIESSKWSQLNRLSR